jgi:hypothetical protein
MPDDLERLSAYLDNALSTADRRTLESRLKTDAELRSELESLRQTVQALRSAPELAVPRNFTLDPAKYRRATPWWARYQRMQLLASLGTAAAVLLIAAGILFSSSSSQLASPASSNTGSAIALQATQMPSEERDQTDDQETAGAAQRSASSETPLPSMTTDAAFSYVPTTTLSAVLAATTTQSAQDSASEMAATATETATPEPMMASIPMATGTAMPPAAAQTSIFKGATGSPTDLYAPVASTPIAEGDGGAVGGAQPDRQATIVMQQATQAAVNLTLSTATAASTMLPPTAQPTMTLVPADMLPTTAPVLPTATPTVTVVQPQPAPSSTQAPPIFIIIGVPLLVFCLMLLGIVWMRSRMR